MKVLVADDYDDTRRVLVLMLKLQGCQTVEALDGVSAIALAESEQPDLILMDLNMPVMDG